MALIGPAVFALGWPLLWHFPVAGVKAYLLNKTQRMLIPVHYLGATWRDTPAPWHYPFVMLAAATPLPILAGAAVAAANALRRARERWRAAAPEALTLAAFAFPVLLLAMPGVPKYDGIRLMLPALPFLAAAAAGGLLCLWDRLRASPGRRALAAACAGALTLWLLLPALLFHPYQLAYYGELVGGPAGARRLGFETTYWGDTFDGKALHFLNRHVPENGAVAFVAFGEFVWRSYLITGDARADIAQADFERDRWDYLVVIPRQGMWDDRVRELVAAREPVWVNTLPAAGGLPLCLIYRR
jgi:hypothetical protein